MLKKHNPSTISPAFSSYSLAVEAPAQARWLHISGQVGVAPDGSFAEGPEAQMEAAFQNILAILGAAGMGLHDLVKITVFLTRSEDIGLYRAVRDRMLAGAEPASTLLVISALADPAWLVEIEAIAAAA
jgi:enamine deaminase RidA (YjgF/YER057c/UK114 family)